jgi:hypothetical protein
MPQPLNIQQFADEVKVEIYKRIQSDHEGEMTEDDFNDIAGDIKSEELDDEINIMYNDEVDRLLCEYGIGDALVLYVAEFGAITKEDGPNTKMLLYTIINDKLNYSLAHDDYLDWCANHCDCE